MDDASRRALGHLLIPGRRGDVPWCRPQPLRFLGGGAFVELQFAPRRVTAGPNAAKNDSPGQPIPGRQLGDAAGARGGPAPSLDSFPENNTAVRLTEGAIPA
jgi:hypothetical protein